MDNTGQNKVEKKGFFKYYALEIYTVISMFILLIAGIKGDTTIIQKFVLVYVFLFVLHEWEEMKYPGGFADLISQMLGIKVNEEKKRESRIPTSILLLSFTIIPFIYHNQPATILPLAFLGLFEGFVHIFAIKLFKLKKPYSPGFVTAQMQAIVSFVLFVYFIKNNIVSSISYFYGLIIMVICFIIMQKTITKMVDFQYKDVFKKIKEQLKK